MVLYTREAGQEEAYLHIMCERELPSARRNANGNAWRDSTWTTAQTPLSGRMIGDCGAHQKTSQLL
jgi:hypothetical protein